MLYAVAAAVFIGAVFAVQGFLAAYFNINRWATPAAGLFLMTVFIRPLENLLGLLADKLLYQRRYDYMITLKNAAKGMALITDVNRLLRLIVHLVSKEIRISGCAIYLFSESADTYIKEVSRGFQALKTSDKIQRETPFINWLIEKRQPLSYDNIQSWIKSETVYPRRFILKKRLQQISSTMQALGASLCIPCFLRGEMIGFMVMGGKLSGERYTRADILLLSTLSNNTAVALENARMYQELDQRIDKLNQLYEEEHTLFWDAASAFSYAIDSKDGYTHAHALKVCDHSIFIARELERLMPYASFNEDFYRTLKMAALLHDVGKIGVSDRILKKQGRLTPEESEQLKNHTLIGETILHPIREIEEIFGLVRHHHENFDGTGYPDGIKGDQIPLISRIIAVANAYDTMTSERPYRRAMEKPEAVEELRSKAGAQFDPVVVKAFLRSIGASGDTAET